MTNPKTSFVLIVVFFGLLSLFSFSTLRVVMGLVNRRQSVATSFSLALVVTAAVALSTLNQFAFIDLVLVITVVFLINWFLRRGEHE